MSRKKTDATPDSPTPDPLANGTATAVAEPPPPKASKPKGKKKPDPSEDKPLPVPTEEKIPLSKLKLNLGTQMRTRLKDERVQELRDVKERGQEIDPIRVWRTPEGDVPSDGFHRIERALQDCEKTINALVYVGTLRDAIKDACSANAIGPMPRDLATQKNAVKALLDDDEWSQNAIGWLAQTAHVSKHLAHQMFQEHHEKRAKDAEKRGEKYPWPKELKDRKGVARPAPARKSEKPTPSKSSSARTTNGPTDDADDSPEADESEMMEPGSDVGEISDSERPEAEAAQPLPKAVDPSVKKDVPDDEWLLTLKRNSDDPLITALPVARRKDYVADAVKWRIVYTNPHVKECAKIINAIAKPETGDRGIVSAAIRSFWGMPSPRDWKLCFACEGSGKHKDGGPCQSEGCDGKGYKRY